MSSPVVKTQNNSVTNDDASIVSSLPTGENINTVVNDDDAEPEEAGAEEAEEPEEDDAEPEDAQEEDEEEDDAEEDAEEDDDIDDDDELDIDDDGNIGTTVTPSVLPSGEKMKIVGLDDLDGDGDVDIDDEDDLEYDPDILKKLDSNRDIIAKIHPEHVSISTDEVNALVKVVRNKERIIVDDLHRTYPVLSKYEKVRIIGQRVKQLNSGCPPYITTEKHIDNYIIAEQEVKEKILPIIIRRPIPSGGCEYWRLQDLEIL